MARDADAYKPINEIRSIESIVKGSKATTRAEADQFFRALYCREYVREQIHH